MVANCSRKKVSHSQKMASAPDSMIFIIRPEWASPWKASGRREHVLVEAAHRVQAVAVGQAFGLQGGDDVGDDAGDADHGPDAEQRAASAPQGGGRELVGAGEHLDDPAEQHRVEELQPGDGEVGDDSTAASRRFRRRPASTRT